MIEPSRVPGDHDLFICGNDVTAKAEVTRLLCEWFGWKPGNIIDLGDITNSRGDVSRPLGALVGHRRQPALQHPRRSREVRSYEQNEDVCELR
jgi:hypothetical protein